ncbi:LacI family transcriptional regulator [Aureimonas altamirensis]|uniref:LacI family DNA-binding transcriptional regulator n=1 Tax=Aureimonas altamirensis TaxID=370622 RepID=UPI001E30A624|nr:LacI family DNA-binding transcriptional regulator [Aureimonas altamirensis]UHD44564.1 LacI family transcriptional regulator [Aureimonas altamirensis]
MTVRRARAGEAGKPPRVRDVARLAGVSTATVSRTLSNPALVSEATRLTVERAIRESGYTVNLAARNLRQNRTGGVLALVPSIANPFFSRILAGIGAVLRAEGLNLLIADTRVMPDERGRLFDLASRSRTDGLIVLDGSIPPDVLTAEAAPPVVQACEWIEGLHAPSVRADNAGGASLAVGHLVELGHRQIGHLEGPPDNRLTQARTEGLLAGLAANGLALDPQWSLTGDFSLESGRAAAHRIAAMRDRPTAVICDNDEMACGFIAELQRLGLTVPDDLSVVGFDDIEFAAHVTPALTTIRQQREEIGSAAARLMLDLLAGRDTKAETILSVELVVRASTAAIRS